MVQGTGGSGKSWLMRHLWVRNPRNSILVNLGITQPNANFLSEMLNDISARISSRTSQNELADTTSNRRIIWDNGRVIDELRHALEQSRTRYCVFVDGVDEIEPLILDMKLLPAFRELKGTLRFIFAGRANPFFDRLDALVPPPQILMLGHLQRDDVITLVNNTLRGRGLSVDERSLEAIFERSEGIPFVVYLMAEMLKEGHTIEKVLEPPETQYILHRVIGHLVAGGVPDEVLRALTSLLLTKRDIMWEELQRELNTSDSIMQALQSIVKSTGFFMLEPAGEHHRLRIHDRVLDGLRRHYRLTDEGAAHQD